MVKIVLEIADNGVIKTIKDDNINGAGSPLETKTVYDFDSDIRHERKMAFFYTLAEDLGIETGNKFEKNNLIMSIDWGKSYCPTKKEIESKINKLNLEIEALKLFGEELEYWPKEEE